MTNPDAAAPGGPGRSVGARQVWGPGDRAHHHTGSPDKEPRPDKLLQRVKGLTYKINKGIKLKWKNKKIKKIWPCFLGSHVL